MGFLMHVLPVVLHCLACSAEDDASSNRLIVQVQSGKGFDGLFAEKVNALHGGESPQDVKRLLGPPQIEHVQCSKDFECKRKYYSIHYCRPDADNCKLDVLFIFNNNGLLVAQNDGFLFGISSNVPEIISRDFDDLYAPDWWRERKAGEKAAKEIAHEREASTDVVTSEKASQLAENAFLDATSHQVSKYSIRLSASDEREWLFWVQGKDEFARPGFHWLVHVDKKTGTAKVIPGQ